MTRTREFMSMLSASLLEITLDTRKIKFARSEIADTDLCQVTSVYALCDSRRICTQGCSAGIAGASFVGFGGGVIGGFSV
jgi:hypothetical protein